MATTEQCRFCLDGDDPKNLITPCSCKGTFKYVHSKCLFQWYEVQPEKGMSCSVCLDELAYRTSCVMECIQKPDGLLGVSLHKPFSMCLVYHLIYIYIFHTALGLPSRSTYAIFQGGLHGFYLYGLGFLISHVKNRALYREEWITKARIVLLLLHVYLLASIERTGWLGGIAADMCLPVYFYEHYIILQSFNSNYRIEFISKKEGLPQQPS